MSKWIRWRIAPELYYTQLLLKQSTAYWSNPVNCDRVKKRRWGLNKIVEIFLPQGSAANLFKNIQNKFTMKHYEARDTMSMHSYLHFFSHLSNEKKRRYENQWKVNQFFLCKAKFLFFMSPSKFSIRIKNFKPSAK